MKMFRRIMTTFFWVCCLLMPVACAGNHPGQMYPDTPGSIMADDGVAFTGNFLIQPSQPFTVGFDFLNKGSDPVTLDSFAFVKAPANIVTVATALSRPLENDKGLLQVGGLGYPPELPTSHRPWHFHALKGAIVQPNEYVEAIISLKSAEKGAFLVTGFLLTLEISGITYQHYFPTTVFLCIGVDHDTCQKAVDQAESLKS